MICSRCKQDLLPDNFYQYKSGKYARYCKPCNIQYRKEYYTKNSERIKTKTRKWSADNKERKAASDKAYALNNKEKIATASREYAQRNKDKINAYSNEWRAKNLEKTRGVESAYRDRNRDACNKRVSDWKKANRDKLCYYSSIRRSAMLNAVPSWYGEFDDFVITEAYKLAQLRNKVTGVSWHVDHIVPIKGVTVSGLHCANNIAVIPWIDNILKGNRYWPDMPDSGKIRL